MEQDFSIRRKSSSYPNMFHNHCQVMLAKNIIQESPWTTYFEINMYTKEFWEYLHSLFQTCKTCLKIKIKCFRQNFFFFFSGYVLYGFEEIAQWHAESNSSISINLKRWKSSGSIYFVIAQYRIVSPYHCDTGIEVSILK